LYELKSPPPIGAALLREMPHLRSELVLSLRTCFVSASDPEVRLDPQRSQQLRPSRRLADHSTSNRPTHSMGILLHTFGWTPTTIKTVHLGYLKTNASYVTPIVAGFLF